MTMVRIAIIGATGYGGVELLRLLERHPYARVSKIISGSHDGDLLADIYPHLRQLQLDQLEPLDVQEIAAQIDVAFFATPSGVSKDYIPELLDLGVRCIDLSGDFRLRSPGDYDKWYKYSSAPSQDYLTQAVYGLSEIFPQEIQTAKLIANPGCYPTTSLLALIPAIQQGLIKPSSIVIDGKSGVSGAGRGVSLNTHFSEVNENVKAYKLGVHQHIPEIEQILTQATGESMTVTFSTHLIPMTRGMMCTIYTDMVQTLTTQQVIDCFQEYYNHQPFVRIRPAGELPATKDVVGSNYCDLGFMADARTGKLMIISVIDNLVKGAAGQGIQNMNIQQGWAQATGLTGVPVYP